MPAGKAEPNKPATAENPVPERRFPGNFLDSSLTGVIGYNNHHFVSVLVPNRLQIGPSLHSPVPRSRPIRLCEIGSELRGAENAAARAPAGKIRAGNSLDGWQKVLSGCTLLSNASDPA
jgi:hypothetical protein